MSALTFVQIIQLAKYFFFISLTLKKHTQNEIVKLKQIRNGTPYCVCNSEHFGEKCERFIKDYCQDKVCSNGGSCTFNETIKEAECSCMRGYSGKSCEIRNLCKTQNKTPCYNNGTCLVGPNNEELCTKFAHFYFKLNSCFIQFRILINQGECAMGFSGDNCELSLRNNANNSIGRSDFHLLRLLFFSFLLLFICVQMMNYL